MRFWSWFQSRALLVDVGRGATNNKTNTTNEMKLIAATTALCALASARGRHLRGRGNDDDGEMGCFAWTALGIERVFFDAWMDVAEEESFVPLVGDRFTEAQRRFWRERVDPAAAPEDLADVGLLASCEERIAMAAPGVGDGDASRIELEEHGERDWDDGEDQGWELDAAGADGEDGDDDGKGENDDQNDEDGNDREEDEDTEQDEDGERGDDYTNDEDGEDDDEGDEDENNGYHDTGDDDDDDYQRGDEDNKGNEDDRDDEEDDYDYDDNDDDGGDGDHENIDEGYRDEEEFDYDYANDNGDYDGGNYENDKEHSKDDGYNGQL